MKIKISRFVVLSAIIAGCNAPHDRTAATSDSVDGDSVAKADSIPIDSIVAGSVILEGNVYMYGETADKTFCDSQKFLPGDCNGGIFFFTAKGNVIMESWCYGSDTTIVVSGTYKETENGISCVLEHSYSYYNGYTNEDEPERAYDPNAGKSSKLEKPVLIDMEKLSCGKFFYGYHSEDGKGNYVLLKPDVSRSDKFKREISNIAMFKNY